MTCIFLTFSGRVHMFWSSIFVSVYYLRQILHIFYHRAIKECWYLLTLWWSRWRFTAVSLVISLLRWPGLLSISPKEKQDHINIPAWCLLWMVICPHLEWNILRNSPHDVRKYIYNESVAIITFSPRFLQRNNQCDFPIWTFNSRLQ